MEEIWKFYKETNSNTWGHRIYEVSNLGRVKCNGKLHICSMIRGYYTLCGELLHRIVAKLFLPDWDPNKEIDHINTVKTDNRVENLCMCDHKENCNNPITKKHYSISNSKSKLGNHYRPTKIILQYTKDNIFIAEYSSSYEAERQTGISQSNIITCCKHRYKSAGGYIWKYKKSK